MSNSTLINGDCFEVMAAMPGHVDLICTDPPYLLSNGGTTVSNGKRVSVNKGDWDVSKGPLEDHEFHLKWLKECQRVLKPSGSIWVSATHHALYSIGFAMNKLGFKIINQVVWQKTNPPPHLACRYLTHSHENLIWAAPGEFTPLKHTFNYDYLKADNGGKQLKDVWTFSAPGKDEKTFGKHPTMKPQALLERIILASTNPGDLVLDPFMGSGSTGVAALKHGRDFIGIEMDEQYVEIAQNRIEEVRNANP